MSAADKIAEAHPPQMWATCEWCVEHRNEEAVTLPDEIRWDGQKWSCEDCWDPEDDGWDHALKASDLADAQAQEIARLRGGRIDWEWLDAEITAIPTRYHGDPSHDHDAYWFKTEVLDLIRKAAGWDTDACAALGSEQDDPLMRTTFHVQV